MSDIEKPFAKMPKAATFDLDMSDGAVRVLLAVAFHANKHGRSYVSAQGIARRLNLDVRSVQRHLKTLRSAGYLTALGSQKTDDGRWLKMHRVEFPETTPDVVSEFSQTTVDVVSGDGETTPDVAPSDDTSGRNDTQCREKTTPSVAPITRRSEQDSSLSKREARGTRFTKTGILPSAWREFAQQERPGLDPDRVFARFKDYWISKPGKDGIKTDWFATWRNWVRRERTASTQRRGGNAQELRDALAVNIERADNEQ